MKPMLNSPGFKCLKLKYDGALSSSAFNDNLRCYNAADEIPTDLADLPEKLAGAYTRPLCSST